VSPSSYSSRGSNVPLKAFLNFRLLLVFFHPPSSSLLPPAISQVFLRKRPFFSNMFFHTVALSLPPFTQGISTFLFLLSRSFLPMVFDWAAYSCFYYCPPNVVPPSSSLSRRLLLLPCFILPPFAFFFLLSPKVHADAAGRAPVLAHLKFSPVGVFARALT